MSEPQWYYTRNGQQAGPVAVETLRQMVQTGQLQAQDYVWREGMGNWLPAEQVAEVFPSASPGHDPSFGGSPQLGLNYYTPQATVFYAGFWLRFVAAIIDGLVTGFVGMIAGGFAGGVIGAAIGGAGGSREEIRLAATVVGQLLSILIGWLYFALMESSKNQATLGKMALGLKVTDLNGLRITFGRASGRYFGKFLSAIILAVGYIMAAFTERKQALHDLLAGCLVIRTRA